MDRKVVSFFFLVLLLIFTSYILKLWENQGSTPPGNPGIDPPENQKVLVPAILNELSTAEKIDLFHTLRGGGLSPLYFPFHLASSPPGPGDPFFSPWEFTLFLGYLDQENYKKGALYLENPQVTPLERVRILSRLNRKGELKKAVEEGLNLPGGYSSMFKFFHSADLENLAIQKSILNFQKENLLNTQKGLLGIPFETLPPPLFSWPGLKGRELFPLDLFKGEWDEVETLFGIMGEKPRKFLPGQFSNWLEKLLKRDDSSLPPLQAYRLGIRLLSLSQEVGSGKSELSLKIVSRLKSLCERVPTLKRNLFTLELLGKQLQTPSPIERVNPYFQILEKGDFKEIFSYLFRKEPSWVEGNDREKKKIIFNLTILSYILRRDGKRLVPIAPLTPPFDPPDPLSLTLLGLLGEHQGDKAMAERYYQEAIQKKRGSAPFAESRFQKIRPGPTPEHELPPNRE